MLTCLAEFMCLVTIYSCTSPTLPCCVKVWQARQVVLQVICSRDVKVAGLLGSAAAMDAKSSAVAEQQVGLGGTTKWKLASLVSALPLVSCALSL